MSLKCQNCGQRLDAGDTSIIRVAQARFEERQHRCPNCSALIAIEIGPKDDTERSPPGLDQPPPGSDR